MIVLSDSSNSILLSKELRYANSLGKICANKTQEIHFLFIKTDIKNINKDIRKSIYFQKINIKMPRLSRLIFINRGKN